MQPLVDAFREVQGRRRRRSPRRPSSSKIRTCASSRRRRLKSLEIAARRSAGEQLKILLVPKDPNDEKNVVLEIRAGTGGDEAALFASDLFRMYSRYAERQGWKLEVLNLSDTGRRHQGSHRAHRGTQRLQPAEVRERRAPRAARARDRSERTHPYVHGDRRGAARSGGSGHPDRREGSARRHVLLERTRRPERQHDLLRRPHHSHPDRTRRVAAGREVADQEPREGDEGAALASLRDGDAEAAGGHRQGSADAGRHRRTLRENPHLQLPREPHHRSPHRLHDAPARPRRSTATSAS